MRGIHLLMKQMTLDAEWQRCRLPLLDVCIIITNIEYFWNCMDTFNCENLYDIIHVQFRSGIVYMLLSLRSTTHFHTRIQLHNFLPFHFHLDIRCTFSPYGLITSWLWHRYVKFLKTMPWELRPHRMKVNLGWLLLGCGIICFYQRKGRTPCYGRRYSSQLNFQV